MWTIPSSSREVHPRCNALALGSPGYGLILDSADNLRHTVHAFKDPAEVRMKTWLPFGLNEGSPLFGREDEVKVQAEEG